MVRRSMARLVAQPGQNTSSQGVRASSAALIVGDHSMSRPNLSLGARSSVGGCLLGARLDVESPRANSHYGLPSLLLGFW
jgi:hypothetical protein